jgi:ribosomal protein S18 acetylase RimI-like enzyme
MLFLTNGTISLTNGVDDFAGYTEKDFLEALCKAIENKEAVVAEANGVVAGLLLFSRSAKELTFLATRPWYREKGIAKALIDEMKTCFRKGDAIHVITFRDGDAKGAAARACYHSCGFTDAEEVTVFDYPCQKMVCVV